MKNNDEGRLNFLANHLGITIQSCKLLMKRTHMIRCARSPGSSWLMAYGL